MTEHVIVFPTASARRAAPERAARPRRAGRRTALLAGVATGLAAPTPALLVLGVGPALTELRAALTVLAAGGLSILVDRAARGRAAGRRPGRTSVAVSRAAPGASCPTRPARRPHGSVVPLRRAA